MGSMNISFADVESGFDAIPEGSYEAIIDKVEVRESKSSDHNYLNFEVLLTEGEFEGRRVWMINSFSPKALFRLKETCEALGFDDEDLEFEWDDDVDITPQAGPLLIQPNFDGMACLAVITNEVYEGKERSRCNELRALDGGDVPAKKAPSSGAAKKPAARGRRAVR